MILPIQSYYLFSTGLLLPSTSHSHAHTLEPVITDKSQLPHLTLFPPLIFSEHSFRLQQDITKPLQSTNATIQFTTGHSLSPYSA